MPSPMPAPMAPPAMINPPPMSAPAAIVGSIFLSSLISGRGSTRGFVVLTGGDSGQLSVAFFMIQFHRLAEVQDRQQREDEGLDQTDEEIERLPDGIGYRH